MKNKMLLFEIALCLLPILLFGGWFYLAFCQAADDQYRVSERHTSVVFDFNNLWDMQFPEEFTSVYVFYNRGGWMGEGDFFAAYECTEYGGEFFKDFTKDYNDEVQERTQSYFDHFPYDSDKYEIILDGNYQPDWEHNFISVAYHKAQYKIYIGKDSCEEYCDDHLYMSYFPEIKMLYIYESIT